MPETASAGTVQEADSAQLPQSISPVADSLRQAGCDCGRDAEGWTVATLRAPSAAVVAHPVDVEAVVAGGRIDLEVDRLPLIDADVGGKALDVRVCPRR